MKCALSDHPLKRTIALQLKSQPLLARLDDATHAELAARLVVHEAQRGERLLEQGSQAPQQFFVIQGLLKRVVTSPEGREMTLRFVSENDMETCYEAWRQHRGSAFSVVCAKRALVASLPIADWCDFIERQPAVQRAFHDRLVQLGAALVEHAIGLLLLDAPSRLNRFSDRHPELAERLPQKDLASHLNLSAETLCRLSRRARPAMPVACAA
jgi:CRP-like cAMP-binding protein